VSTTRTKTILALEQVRDECRAMLDQAIRVNEMIRGLHLPVLPLDLPAIWKTQEAAECMLREMELRAGIDAPAPPHSQGALRPEQTISHGVVYR